MRDFVSSTGAIYDSLQDTLARHELQRRQLLEEEKAKEELKLRQAADKRASEAAAEAAKTAEVQRRAAEETITRGQRTDVEKRLTEVGMNGEVSGDLLEQAKRLVPESLKVTASHEQNTLPAATVNPETGARTQFSQETPFTVADQTAYAGTREERTNRELSTKMGGAKSRQEAVQIALDAGVPANQVDDVVNTIFKPKGNVWWQTRTGELQFIGANGKPGPAPTGVTYDKSTDTIEKEPAPPGAGGGAPFFIPVQGAQGVTPFAGRTGQHWDVEANGGKGGWVDGAITPAPSAEISRDIRNAALVTNRIEDVKKMFDPAKVGVIAGRLKNLQSQYWGSDPDYAAFQQQLTTLANTVIQLRTGAQMSVNESNRILKEVASGTLPVDTFTARLGELEKEFDEYLSYSAKIGYRKFTKDDIEKMTNGEAPARPGATTTPTETPKPTTPAKSKYKVTVS